MGSRRITRGGALVRPCALYAWLLAASALPAAGAWSSSSSSASAPRWRSWALSAWLLAASAPPSAGQSSSSAALARRLRPLLRRAASQAVATAALPASGRSAEWARVVETSRCAALLRERLRGRDGPIVDFGVGPMVTAWFLREGRHVVAIAPGSAAPEQELLSAGGIVHLPGQKLSQVLEALRALSTEPALIFVQPSLVVGGAKGGRSAEREDWDALAQARTIFPGVPAAGVMLTAEGQEIPHWIIPSLFAPVLGAQNNLTVELPCWSTGGCSKASTRPLLSLVMIIKNEARRIRETLESVAPAVDQVVILDTGSQDGTQKIIQDTCARFKLPLQLYEEPFVDFSATRNRVLQLASGSSEFVLMLSGDETLKHPEQLRIFVQQHAGYCGVTENLFNLRVFMGPNVWYWSERLMRADNHAAPGWPAGNSTWRYVGVTHEAYVNPVLTMGGDLFLQYVGDSVAPPNAQGMPAPVAGEFFVSHDAEKTQEQQRKRLLMDVHLLEAYLDRPDAHEDKWQYARALFYLAQSHRGLGFGAVARELWERYLALDMAAWRQFSYLRYGAHLALGQICAEDHLRLAQEEVLPTACRSHFEDAHKLCPRIEPLVYLAMALPAPSQGRLRLEVLRRAAAVAHMQASTGHCAVHAEPELYARLPQLLHEAEAAAA